MTGTSVPCGVVGGTPASPVGGTRLQVADTFNRRVLIRDSVVQGGGQPVDGVPGRGDGPEAGDPTA